MIKEEASFSKSEIIQNEKQKIPTLLSKIILVNKSNFHIQLQEFQKLLKNEKKKKTYLFINVEFSNLKIFSDNKIDKNDNVSVCLYSNISLVCKQ